MNRFGDFNIRSIAKTKDFSIQAVCDAHQSLTSLKISDSLRTEIHALKLEERLLKAVNPKYPIRDQAGGNK